MFSGWPGVEAISAGTNADAGTPVSGDLIGWADVVLVMEPFHRDRIATKYRALLKGKRWIGLDVPDRYEYMQPELVRLLEVKVTKMLGITKARHGADAR